MIQCSEYTLLLFDIICNQTAFGCKHETLVAPASAVPHLFVNVTRYGEIAFSDLV